MKGLLIGLAVILILILAIGGWLKGTYNGLVQSDQQVKAAWAQVQTVLQRRLDLIPNLVETVKGYASHERETLTAVTEARAKVAGATTPGQQIQANQELTGALGRLMVVVEAYPNLKADQSFQNLQFELAGTENRIAVERGRYNQTVQEFNTRVRSFPAVLVAGMFHFQPAQMFEATPEAAQAPKVNFSGQPAPAGQ